MTYQPHLIANYQTGLDSDLAPWLLPQDAFQEIENGYIRHGKIIKRNGLQLLATAGSTKITGIYLYIKNNGEREVIVTNSRRTYRFVPGTVTFDPIDLADVWTTDNYMWFANFGVTGSVTENTLYMTNFAGNIRTYVTGALVTNPFLPNYSAVATDVVTKCLMIFPFKNRLVLLNTFENSLSPTQKPQRARWSQAQNPNNWRDDIAGQGGFVDAPTGDFIIGARFLQEMLIVFFSNSTWTLRPTSDPALPFRWDKINSFRACDATFATIGHDRYVVSFGNRGITACSGVEDQRIDEKISQFTVNEIDAENFNQCYSDRDYTLQHSWTLYPEDNDSSSGQNTKALIRSETDNSWSVFSFQVDEDTPKTLSCVGHGESYQDWTFADFTGDYDYSFDSFDSDEDFLSFYIQKNSDLFLAGDYEGNVFIVGEGGDDDGAAINFSLTGAGWNPYKEQGIEAQMGWVDLYVDVDTQTQATISFYTNDEIQPYATQTVNFIPEQGFIGDIGLVSLTNPCEINCAQHGLLTGNQVYIAGVDGTTDVNNGPYTITVVDENNFTLDGVDATGFSAYEGGGVVVEYDPRAFQRVWKRVYAGGTGNTHTVKVESTGVNRFLTIHSITPYFRPASGRMIA